MPRYREGFNARQQRFCDEYLIDMNGTRAAIRAGYSEHTAREIGSKLLTRPNVSQYIAERQKLLQNSKIADAAEVERYLTAAMRNELDEEIVAFDHEGSPLKVVKKLAGREKIKAAELMARRHGLLTDRIQAEITGTIIIDGNDDMQDGNKDDA
jgi:phage terminase small subunit